MQRFEPQKQRDFATSLVEQLRAAGFEALWAGGCVRDQLLGRIPKDYDVATSATPEQIRQLFGRRRTIPIGAAFGVITVLGPEQAGQIEVATFREDFEYTDGRRPSRVLYSSAEEDAKRRDFTINGLFYDPITAEVIDYVGGRADLEAHQIRAIGSPVERFDEDKLRVLRAVRFSATFSFEIEPATWDAICENPTAIEVVSPERIAAEMRRMLVESHRAYGLRLLRESRLWASIVTDDLADPPADAWTTAIEVSDCLGAPTFETALAALLGPLTDSVGVRALGAKWKLANAEIDRACWLVEHVDVLDRAADTPWPRLQPVLVQPGIEELLAWGDARAAARVSDSGTLDYLREKLSLPPEELNPAPLLDGADLKQCGIHPGPIYSKLLSEVRDQQLAGELRSKEDALRWVRENGPT